MKLKRADILIISLLLILAGSMYCFSYFAKAEGALVTVKSDGEIIAKYPLNEDITVKIGNDENYNILEIKNGKAGIIEADCPDKLCVKQKKISSNGETVICLPHKLVVEIESGDNSDIDSVS